MLFYKRSRCIWQNESDPQDDGAIIYFTTPNATPANTQINARAATCASASDTACRLLDEQHGNKLSYANLQGEKYIRLVCVNPEFDEGAIEDVFAKIKMLALAESA